MSATDGRDSRELQADFVWSTIPLTLLARMVSPEPPADVQEAAGAMRFRSMILVYLQVPVHRFTPFDAHYFPSEQVAITRLSEPKNYAALDEPRGRTVLCAELPCTPTDRWWQMSDDELGRVVASDLATAGIPLPAAPTAVLTRRLSHAYPVYLNGYERHFEALDNWIGRLPALTSFGRQGLFAHDNTHHALAMAYAAVDCLGPGGFDTTRWAQYRKEFESHVVED